MSNTITIGVQIQLSCAPVSCILNWLSCISRIVVRAFRILIKVFAKTINLLTWYIANYDIQGVSGMLIVASTINILLLNHEFFDLKVQSVASRSLEFHELCCIAACICEICEICVTLNRVWRCILCDILKYSTCMLIVRKLLTCPKRPVHRGLKGVMLIG